jgi:hypothetical protein
VKRMLSVLIIAAASREEMWGNYQSPLPYGTCVSTAAARRSAFSVLNLHATRSFLMVDVRLIIEVSPYR